MDVILTVTVDAEVAGASEPLIANMATIATLLVMGTLQAELAHIMHRSNIGEGLCGVAVTAQGS
jgi:hypothetical protein